MRSIGSVERALIVGSVVNGALGAALGALTAGVPGAQLGLIAGLLLAALPLALREVWVWLSRPAGFPRHVVARTADATVAVAQAIVDVMGSALGPAAESLRGPVLVSRIAVDVAARALSALLGGFWRIVATPLGMANVAALAVIAANLAHLDFAAPIAFLALGLLLLMLLVNESEARDEAISCHG